MDEKKSRENLLIMLIRRYFTHNVTQSGAELAYFFLFALVPSLIFLNTLLGLFHLDLEAAVNMFSVIPEDVRNIITGYLEYLSAKKSTRLMVTGLALSFISAVRAVNALIAAINRAYAITHRRVGFSGLMLSMLLTGILITQILLSLFLLVAGSWILSFMEKYFITVARYGSLWSFIGFVIVYLCGLMALTILYTVAPMKKIRIKAALPGAFASESAWILLSGLFSFYASHLSHYSLLYGSLGAVIVLMLWFFLTGVILVMGGELNALIEKKGGIRNKRERG